MVNALSKGFHTVNDRNPALGCKGVVIRAHVNSDSLRTHSDTVHGPCATLGLQDDMVYAELVRYIWSVRSPWCVLPSFGTSNPVQATTKNYG